MLAERPDADGEVRLKGADRGGKTPADRPEKSQTIDWGEFGGGGRDRTADLRVMNPIKVDDSKEDIGVISAESGELRQSLQPPRTQIVEATTHETAQVGESDSIQIQGNLSRCGRSSAAT